MALPRHLYHGTSERHLTTILNDGLVPRGRRKGNWKHSILSAPDRVYLTNAYPIYFAFAATTPGSKEGGVIIEVDTELMAAQRFVPDEDALEQSTRGRDNVSGNIKERTLHYRNAAPMYSMFADESIAALGTCAYMGKVEAQHISRVAVISHDKLIELALHFDPMISLANYYIMGEHYRSSVRWLSEGDDLFPHITRDGINVFAPTQVAA